MLTVSILIALVALFYVLGRAADLAIYNIRRIGENFGIRVFFLGIMLGFFTSMPELAVGINSTINNLSPIALGNLLGGIIVLLGLILGLAAILHRQIITGEKANSILPIFAYFLLPLILIFDGQLGWLDGLVLTGAYFLIVFLFYRYQKHHSINHGFIIRKDHLAQHIFLVVLGLTLVVIISNVIVRITFVLLQQWTIPAFILGLILFSIGTNLPEIIITFRSWRRKIKDLSTSNLFGSGMANILMLGILALVKPIQIDIQPSLYLLAFFMVLLFANIFIFYRTDKQLTRNEGLILVTLYVIFVISQVGVTFIHEMR